MGDSLLAEVSVLPRRPQASGKRKRVVLSIHEKQQVLGRLDAGELPVNIAQAFGISRQQVSDIKKNRKRILSFCTDAKHLSTLRRKTLRVSTEFHPGVEQELYRWIIRQRRLERNVSADELQDKATKLFTQYSAEEGMTAKAVTEWLRHFKRAHGIKFCTKEELARLPENFAPAMDGVKSSDAVSVHSEGSTASEAAASDSMVVITTTSGGVAVGAPTTAFFVNGMATVPVSGGVVAVAADTAGLDVNAYNMVHSQDSVVVVPTSSMQRTVTTINQLNEQLQRFEQTMTTKLDTLDERIAKASSAALFSRLSPCTN